MKILPRQRALKVSGFETLMEGADMRVVMLTLAAGESVPWHYHSEISDLFVCLAGPMVVETRAPTSRHQLLAGERVTVPGKTAHFVHGLDNGPCQFLVIQGIGVYDNVPIGGH